MTKNAYEKSRERLLPEFISYVASLRISDALEAMADHYEQKADDASYEARLVKNRAPDHEKYELNHRLASVELRKLVKKLKV